MQEIAASIDILKKAQMFDRELFFAVEHLKEVPSERAKIEQILEAEKRQVKELEAAYKTLQLKQKEKELELGQKEAHVKKLEGQLSQVKTNKEYSALQQEISSLKADNSLLEDQILRIFDEVEAARDALKNEQKRVDDCEKNFAQKEKELSQKEKTLRDEIEKLKKERQDAVMQLNPEIRSHYDLIVDKKQGIGLAKINGDICGACQMKLRPQLVNDVMLGEVLVFCESCSRILYLEKE